VVVTIATARPELISPGDVSEAEVEGLGLVAGPDDLVRLGWV
jgi:hypothetical protein